MSQNAILQAPFLASQVDQTERGFSPAAGVWPTMATSTELKGNNAGTGGYLQVNVAVIDGPEKEKESRLIFNLYHADASVAKRAAEDWARFLNTIGLGTTPVQDTSIICQRPFLGIYTDRTDEQAKGKGWTQLQRFRDVNGLKPWDPSAPPLAVGPAAASTPPASSSQGAPPVTAGAPAPVAPPVVAPVEAPPVAAAPPAAPAAPPWQAGSAAPAPAAAPVVAPGGAVPPWLAGK